jgi:hypothetical protein
VSNTPHFLANHRSFQPIPRSPKRPTPAAWVWPAVVAVASGPFVLTAIGLSMVALRPPPRPAAEVVAVPVIVPAVSDEPPAPVEEIVAAPRPVEIGDALSPTDPPTPVAAVASESAKVAPAKPSRCERFGTAIDFVRSPTLAFDRAARDQKLVMVLHLAGYFDDPGFT